MQNKRLISLDLLRGITILTMVLVNNPGDWSNVYPELLHAEWNGCKLADFVFPFFIFILGMAIPLANPNKEQSFTNGTKYLIRSLRIFCLGLFLNFFNAITIFNLEGTSLLVFRILLTLIIGFALLGNYNFRTKKYTTILLFSCFMYLTFGTVQFQEVRLLGVLQRIGIVYFLASLTYTFFSTRVQIGIVISLLLGYWAMMRLIPVPGVGFANFEIGTNLAAWIDQIILKEHVYAGTKPWDPEGILSTLPAIAQGIMGVLIGQLLLNTSNAIQLMKKLWVIGLVLVFLGVTMSVYFPINKSIWTSSYVVFTSGIAILVFNVLYYLADYKEQKKMFSPLVLWGINPMIVFFLSGVIPRTLAMIQIESLQNKTVTIGLQKYCYTTFLKPLFNTLMNASLAHALVFIVFFHGILYFLYKNNWIIKV
jgi:predicted acyltransferase